MLTVNVKFFCRFNRNDCILVVDAVNSIGSAPLFTDAWKIDVAYTASQQTLNGPPGLVPITIGLKHLF